ncbi:DUF1338 domain-containing protein [bacterium]|nr:DUF1338 domain-containing protein [bacterium]
MSELTRTWDLLWKDYTSFNPHAKLIHDEILVNEKAVDPSRAMLVNDHVAFRTFKSPKIGLDVLAQIFLSMGYEYKKDYHFEQKKLYAKHFEHFQDPEMPKVFISELLTEEFSPEVQKVIEFVNDQVPLELTTCPDFLWSGRSWDVSYKTYQTLLQESEYAAWMYVFGFRPNHFTISFNDLKSFKDLKDLNDFVRSKGHSLNSSGGEIKGSPEEHLEQSSTLAGKVEVDFKEGRFEVPACYYEFAKRYPQKDGKLYTGFVAQSADKIFESTDVKH